MVEWGGEGWVEPCGGVEMVGWRWCGGDGGVEMVRWRWRSIGHGTGRTEIQSSSSVARPPMEAKLESVVAPTSVIKLLLIRNVFNFNPA